MDHFRPKSKFPKRVYWWSNWILACQVCNNKKGGKWAVAGYVDPCAKTKSAQPESYFEFDTMTGELVLRKGLTAARRRRAANTINDLGLNAYHHRQKRVRHLRLVATALQLLDDDDDVAQIAGIVAARDSRLCSITRAWLVEHEYWPTFPP